MGKPSLGQRPQGPLGRPAVAGPDGETTTVAVSYFSRTGESPDTHAGCRSRCGTIRAGPTNHKPKATNHEAAPTRRDVRAAVSPGAGDGRRQGRQGGPRQV